MMKSLVLFCLAFAVVFSICDARPFEIDLENLVEEENAEDVVDVNNGLEENNDLARNLRAPEPEPVPVPEPEPEPVAAPQDLETPKEPGPEKPVEPVKPVKPVEPAQGQLQKPPGEARGGKCYGCIPGTLDCPSGMYYSPYSNKCAKNV